MSATNDKNQKQSFEEVLQKLESCAETLKSPDVSLEAAIKCFEEGLKQYETANAILQEAKQQIEVYTRQSEA